MAFRILLLVLAGWLTVANASQPSPSDTPTPAIAERIQEHPCTGNMREDRQSDLCAQWTAADAARVSGRWAEFSAWSGAVAAIGVVVALALNIWSNIMTRAALSQARDASHADLRPYVHPTMAKIIDFASDSMKASVVFENSGRTPALRAEFFTFLSGEDWFSATAPRELLKKHRVQIGGIPPQAKRQRTMEVAWSRKAFREMDELNKKDAYEPRFVLRGFVTYSDTFGTRYVTEFAYVAKDLPIDATTKFQPVHMDAPIYQQVDERDYEGEAETSVQA